MARYRAADHGGEIHEITCESAVFKPSGWVAFTNQLDNPVGVHTKPITKVVFALFRPRWVQEI